MKKINNLILVCGLIFASFSCEDATDIFPVGNLTSDVTFETLEDLQLGLAMSWVLKKKCNTKLESTLENQQKN